MNSLIAQDNQDSLAQTKEKNNVFRKRATRLGTLTPAKLGLMRITETEKKQGSLGKEKAAELDMDHVFVKFTDFLWAMTFIAPFSYWLWIRGVTQLYARKIFFLSSVLSIPSATMRHSLQPCVWNRLRLFTTMDGRETLQDFTLQISLVGF